MSAAETGDKALVLVLHDLVLLLLRGAAEGTHGTTATAHIAGHRAGARGYKSSTDRALFVVHIVGQVMDLGRDRPVKMYIRVQTHSLKLD